jgi:hypothetical protein
VENKDDALNPIFLNVNRRIRAKVRIAKIQIFFVFTCFKIKLSPNFVNPATLKKRLSESKWNSTKNLIKRILAFGNEVTEIFVLKVRVSRKVSADFMNNNLNRKMRYRGKNSPWISSLRGIDPTGWKCEYEGAQKHWFRLNLRINYRSLQLYGRILLS